MTRVSSSSCHSSASPGRRQTFDAPMKEVIEARIYSGIHFRTSDDVGARLGRQVAHFVMTHALRRPNGSWKN